MTVFDLKRGEFAEITDITLSGGAKSRLSAIGVVKGAKICALSFSLFKSSVLISCGAVRVGIRKKYAQQISCEKVSV